MKNIFWFSFSGAFFFLEKKKVLGKAFYLVIDIKFDMKFKVLLPDKSETPFDDKQAAFRFASTKAKETNRLIKVEGNTDGFTWEQVALIYPTGQIQEGTGGFGFFKRLPVVKRK